MTDAERARQLADEIKRHAFTTGEGYSMVRTRLLDEAISLLAEQSAPSPAPIAIANCSHCGRIIDTREEKDGGDKFGCELADGRWSCSIECYEALTGEEPSRAAADLLETATQAIRSTCGCINHRGCENPDEEFGCACRNDARAVLSAIQKGHAILPREPTEAQVTKVIHTACCARPVGGGDGDTYEVHITTQDSMRAALIEYAALAAKEPAQ